MSRIRSMTYGVLGLIILMLFQNCAANQNFDLEQASKASTDLAQNDSQPDLEPTPTPASQEPTSPDPTPTPSPTPEPTPTPDPTDYSTKGQFCALQSGSLPKVRISVSDLKSVNFSSLNDLAPLFTATYRMSDLNLHVSELNIPGVALTGGLPTGGASVKRADNSDLRSDFGLLYDSHIQLAAANETGYYQLGLAASGQIEVETLSNSGSYRRIARSLLGVNDTRFVCTTESIYLRKGDQFPIRIRQTHGQAPSLSMGLYWRKVSASASAGDLNPSYCGQVQELYSGGNPNSALSSILSNGWSRLTADHFVLITDGPNLVKNGDFENTGLSLPTTAFWQYSSSFPDWNAYVKFEIMGEGYAGISPLRGGKYWLQLDAESGHDAIWQSIKVKKETNYRYLFDVSTPSGTNTNTSSIEAWVAYQANDDFVRLDTVVGPADSKWGTYMKTVKSKQSVDMRVKLREVEGQDNKHGGVIDNIVFREIRENNSICSASHPVNEMKILSASYGSSQFCDASAYVRERCEGKSDCQFPVNNSMCGDPQQGAGKTLHVRYSCPNGDVLQSWNENGQAQLNCP